MNTQNERCVLCGVLFTEQNRSKEHIIPAALGGHRTVANFLCRTCNSKTGDSWDAELAETLHELSLLLGIRRQRGQTPAKVVSTTGGDQVRLLPGGRIELAKPKFYKSYEEGKLAIQFKVRSEQEARRMLADIARRYDQDLDIENIIADNPAQSHYPSDKIHLEIGLGGVYSDKSMVKSALAMALYAGVTPQDATLAVNYLRSSDAVVCIDPCYTRDVILNRVPGMPLNCVYVAGDPGCHRLVAYVEIFGVLRRIICLSDNYEGERFKDYYAFDPTDGSLQSLQFELDPTTIKPSGNEPFDDATIELIRLVLLPVLQKAQGTAVENQIGKLVHDGCNEFLERRNKDEEEPLSEEDVELLIAFVMKRLEPFLAHLIRPTEFPLEALGNLLANDPPAPPDQSQ